MQIVIMFFSFFSYIMLAIINYNLDIQTFIYVYKYNYLIQGLASKC